MSVDSEFEEQLVRHACGLQATDDDFLLYDVQRWLVARGRLAWVPVAEAPCRPECICITQLDEGESRTVICCRPVANPLINRILGRVKFYNPREEYGFVLADSDLDRDIFLHRKYIGSMTPEQLCDGARVSFTVQEGKQGLRVTSILPA